MRIRKATIFDQAATEALHSSSGFEFKFPDIQSPLTECAFVVEDDQGEVMAVAIAKRAPEVVMALSRKGHPITKLRALGLIHEAMRKEIEALGYEEANCFLPPELEKNYGRHLQRIFGWLPAWRGFTIRKRG